MAQPPVERVRLTFRRLFGLDRSGPPPPETLPGAPWRPWTIPNAIGFARLALVPVFLALALSSDSGTDALPAILFAVISWTDYLDGISARVTGQYSRLGTLLDPDATGLAMRGNLVQVDSANCAVWSETERVIAVVGLDDVVVVDTADAVLVAHREKAQDVRRIVDLLRLLERHDLV